MNDKIFGGCKANDWSLGWNNADDSQVNEKIRTVTLGGLETPAPNSVAVQDGNFAAIPTVEIGK